MRKGLIKISIKKSGKGTVSYFKKAERDDVLPHHKYEKEHPKDAGFERC